MNPIMKGLNQGQPQQQQYDFSGGGDRLTKIEEGIASLTNQFNSFQKPGDVAPEYQGNAAPEPFPILPDIDTIASPGPIMGEGSQTQIGGPAEIISGPGIISPMEPPGGLGVPIGGVGRNGPRPSIHTESKPVSPWSQHLIDGEWRQLTPEEFGTKFPNSPFNQNTGMNNQPFQTFASPGGGKGAEQFPWLQGYQGSMSDINAIEDYRVSQIDPRLQHQGAGIMGLANYQLQQNTGPGI